MTKPTIRPATHADCEFLAVFATESFVDTFGHLYEPEQLEAHLNVFFTPRYFLESLEKGDTILLLQHGPQLIAYGKFGKLAIPAPNPPAGAMEIHRIYIHRDFQRHGYGKMMLMHMLGLPQVSTAPAVYLGVWEGNASAQALYQSHMFQPVGHYFYYVGNHADREVIMLLKK